jgi:hypothetical protein
MPVRPITPLRWVAILWLLVWIPAYGKYYGVANFLHLCDLAIFLTVIGLWTRSILLLSSQALSTFIPSALWCMDALSRLITHHHLFGGTEYLFNTRVPLAVRVLSLFHVALPILLLWVLAHTGYDRRAFSLQSFIAAIAMIASRFTQPAANINFAFRAPLFHRTLGHAYLHLLLVYLGVVLICYVPAELLFRKLFSPSPTQS